MTASRYRPGRAGAMVGAAVRTRAGSTDDESVADTHWYDSESPPPAMAIGNSTRSLGSASRTFTAPLRPNASSVGEAEGGSARLVVIACARLESGGVASAPSGRRN